MHFVISQKPCEAGIQFTEEKQTKNISLLLDVD
jgi:hypothetical protein